MASLYLLKAILKSVLLPPIGILLVAAAGMVVATRRPRVGHAMASFAIGVLVLMSIPAVPAALMTLLDPPVPLRAQAARNAGAIVILGGGMRHMAPEYGGEDALGMLTLERVRYGAHVARMTGLPVLVSGGAPQGRTPEATAMARSLEREFAVPVRWIESDSLDTHQNAVRTTRLLRDAGIGTIVLVTHAFDMRRAAAEFRSLGLEVIPAATNLPRHGPMQLMDWVPSVGALHATYFVCYEIAANVALWFRKALS